MFGIPWRLIGGMILGAVLVKESPGAGKLYDSTKKKIAEAVHKAKASWNTTAPFKVSETTGTIALGSVPDAHPAAQGAKEN